MDSCLSQGDLCKVKYKQPCPEFELGSPSPFHVMITVMLSMFYVNRQPILMNQLKAVPVEDFQHHFQLWKKCICECVPSQGNYFGGDKVDL